MFPLPQASTGKGRVALWVMLNLPLALIGGGAALHPHQRPPPPSHTPGFFRLSSSRHVAPVISIAGMVGFVTLFGIAVRNGILLVNLYDHLQTRERKSIGDSIIEGSMERLAPILMTAFTSLLGLVPFALAKGEPGAMRRTRAERYPRGRLFSTQRPRCRASCSTSRLSSRLRPGPSAKGVSGPASKAATASARAAAPASLVFNMEPNPTLTGSPAPSPRGTRRRRASPRWSGRSGTSGPQSRCSAAPSP